MRIGVVFPQTEMSGDAGAIRAYGEAADDLGYTHVAAYDHVLGADTTVHHNWSGPYDLDSTFHEPFTLFSFLAGFTSLDFATSILISPQRQTALVAKQAAQVDLFSRGGFRLGLGLGWNPVEYEALGVDFADRAPLLEEQIEVLRALWTRPSVTYQGRFHTITGAGIAPLPIQQPIPIWLGGVAPAALRRVGRLADGWFPQTRPGGGLEEALDIIWAAAMEAGRDPTQIAFEGRVQWGTGDLTLMQRHLERWRLAGATHLSLNTMDSGLQGVEAHITALNASAEVLLTGP
jgi:probable F420-dependent oxidoreductase